MREDRATNPDQAALRRIIARLLALAAVAESASLRSLPVRILLFLILRPAAAYARNLVIEAAHDLGYQAHLPPDDIGHLALWRGNAAFSVLSLALIFEMLACALEDLSELIASRQPRPRLIIVEGRRCCEQAKLAAPGPWGSSGLLRSIVRAGLARVVIICHDTS